MIRPINCNVLIKPKEVSEKIGSLYMPDTVRDRDQHAAIEGTVVAIADDAFAAVDGIPTLRPEVGSMVFFGRYAGKSVKYEGDDYWILKDVDITAVVS